VKQRRKGKRPQILEPRNMVVLSIPDPSAAVGMTIKKDRDDKLRARKDEKE